MLDAVELPVLAAGGVASPRGLAAVLAAGAAAAWLGTVFTTCVEASTRAAARDRLLAANGENTMLTSEFDIRAGYRWPRTSPSGSSPTKTAPQHR
ncbi:2-nitropropane dioxygenase [Mycolicibacterium smegmatis]|nr:2-nitropropane dioxygenase [Mycolicibacterium smegmatis]